MALCDDITTLLDAIDQIDANDPTLLEQWHRISVALSEDSQETLKLMTAPEHTDLAARLQVVFANINNTLHTHSGPPGGETQPANPVKSSALEQ